MKTLRTIFMGTPDFAIPSLQALIDDNNFEILAVITQPDKKIGRKQIVTPTPIKNIAEKAKLKIFQPDKIKNFVNEIEDLQPDIIVVIAYGQIIPEQILAIPKYGCINVHGSLLPRHRGAACIASAILSGDNETGITVMQMDKGLDTGPIIFQSSINIKTDSTSSSLHDELSELSKKILPKTIISYVEGDLKPKNQDNSLANYFGLLSKKDAKINWSSSTTEIDRFIRAMYSWPIAWTTLNNKKINIINTTISDKPEDILVPGKISILGNKIFIDCLEGKIEVLKLQQEGGKPMSAYDFLRGHANINEQIFN